MYSPLRMRAFNHSTQSPPDEIRLPRQTKGTGRPVSVDEVSDSFFSSFGIRVLRGRLFLSTDTTSTGAAPVAVVSQAFANEFWPGSDPIEQKVVMPDDRYLTVVGVVADTRSERFGRPRRAASLHASRSIRSRRKPLRALRGKRKTSGERHTKGS